jgi:hypothetical protein
VSPSLILRAALAGGLLLALRAAAAGDAAPVPIKPGGERYLYRADATSGKHAGTREMLDMSFTPTGTNIECRSVTTATNVQETVRVRVEADGRLISAEQKSARYGDEWSVRVTLDKNEAVMARTEDGKESITRKSVPADTPALSDLALLTFLRTVPTGATVRVTMADYAQVTAPASIRDAGEEDVTVPAGTFKCRRMEVKIEAFFYRKTMIYWITKDPPHFGVKHSGIRAAFTPEYSTELVKILEPPGAGGAP